MGAVFVFFVFEGRAAEYDKWYVVEEVTPPSESFSEEYRKEARQVRVDTQATYASEVSSEPVEVEISDTEEFSPPGDPIFTQSSALIFILIFLAVAIILWLKFGGSGALFSRNLGKKGEEQQSAIAPENWNLEVDIDELDRESFFRRLEGSNDYRANLIELLRYSLLDVAQISNLVFARSDTEREAFARIPKDYAKVSSLEKILQSSELVKYGGREISSEVYQKTLELGRSILLAGHQSRMKRDD